MPRQASLLPEEWPEWAGAELPKKVGPEELFAAQLAQFKNLAFVRQLLFAKAAMGRRWAFDFAFPEYKLAVEIDGVAVRRLAGQLVVMGRHASIEGIRADHEKTNSAALLGWTVLHFLQTDVKPRHALEMTLRVLQARGWKALG
jgi:very-short-patch-repair endonuclease